MKKCPRCGAQNASTAEWCTLCLARFEPSGRATPAPVEPPPAPEPVEPAPDEIPIERVPASGEAISGGNGEQKTAVAEESPLARGGNGKGMPAVPPAPVRDVPVTFRRDGDTVRWICPACETPNEIDASACRICGTVMARLFAPDQKDKTPAKPTGIAMGLSALLPGLGHAYAGSIATGVSRAGMYVWTVVIAVLFLAKPPAHARGLLRAVGVLFALAALAVWGLSMMEAGRYAEGDHTPIIQARVMTWISAGLTLLLFVGLAAAAFSRG